MRKAFGSFKVLLISAFVGILLGSKLPELFPPWLVQSVSSLVLVGMMYLCGQAIQHENVSKSWRILKTEYIPILLALGLSLSVFALAAAICFWIGWGPMTNLFLMLSFAPVANSSVAWTAVDRDLNAARSRQNESLSSDLIVTASIESTALIAIAFSWLPFLLAVVAISFISSTSLNQLGVLVPIGLSVFGVVLGIVFGGAGNFQKHTIVRSSQINLAFIGVLNLLAAFRFAAVSSIWDEWPAITTAVLTTAINFSLASWIFARMTDAATSRVIIRAALMKNTGIFSAFTLASGGSTTILAALMAYTIAQHLFSALASTLKTRRSIAGPQSSVAAA